MYRYFGEIWTVVFEISKQTNRQTDIHTYRHTNTLIALLRTTTEGEVIIIISVQNNLAKCRIADLSPLRLRMNSTDVDPHLILGSI